MSHLLQLLLLLALTVAAAKIAGALANRAGQPAVFGEILVGLLLGPTLLDVMGWPIFLPTNDPTEGTPVDLLSVVQYIADVGVVLLMFVAGLETDLDEMRRTGKVAFWAAVGGVALPMIGGTVTAAAFGIPIWWQGIFIGAILTATSVSISAQTLLELGAIRTREGSAILGAAVIDDVMGIIILSVVAAFAGAQGSNTNVGQIALVGLRIVLFAGLAVLARCSIAPVLRFATRLRVSQSTLGAVLVIVFLYAWAAEYIGGMAAITGAYIAGILVAQTEFKKDVDAGIHPLTYSLFVPVFFISIGLQANGRELGDRVAFTIALVIVAIVAKAAGCGLFARVFGFNTIESIRMGVGMISRGEVGLILAGYGLANGLIGRDIFSASVIMVLVTTMVTPPLLKLTFPTRPEVDVVVEETIGGPPEKVEDTQ